MTQRERFIKTLTFGRPDKYTFNAGGGRESTLARWRSEGLPEGQDPARFVMNELGLEIPREGPPKEFFCNGRMIPIFEEKVLKHENGHYIVQDWMGAITEISDVFDYTYIRNAVDFVTRKWHKFPVETAEDWAEMKKRFDPDEPSRLPANLAELGKTVKDRNYVLTVHFNGPFWQLREWLGFENLCIAFIDRPEFVADMIEFWTNFVLKMLERLLPHIQPDCVHLSEDMAYKAHSMISPAMTREYILPSYTKWVNLLKKFNVPIVDMDSDGFIEELIPIWIDSGINVCDPIEVAAHNDIVKFRKMFGKNMGYTGGVDKRAIAKGGKTLLDEIKRIEVVLETGGYIPGCDHGIPGDVSFANYKEFVKLLAKITGWL